MERRLGHNLVKACRMRPPEPGGVGVIGEAEDRDVEVGVRDIRCIHPRNVHDHEIRRLDAVRGLKAMPRQRALQLSADEQIDSNQQNGCHD